MKRLFSVAATVIALAAAQFVFGGKNGEAMELPAPGAVTGIDIGDDAVVLDKAGGEWTARQLPGAPVDEAKIRRLLDALLAGNLSPLPPGFDPAATGLADGEGLRIAIGTASGGAAEFFLGLRPEGDFDSVYVKMPDSAVRLLRADLRGELGLWENRQGETPDPSVWLAPGAGFDPAAVTGLSASYPDHEIVLTRTPGEDTWTLASPAPGGELSQDGVRSWLSDLSTLRFAGVAPLPPPEESWTHSIILALADGSEVALRAAPGRAGGDALAALTPYPAVFVLPAWRFADCFNRVDSLFPKAAPRFALEDVLLLDVRQGGESVKIMRRDGGWEPVALPCPVQADRLERLARFLANWRPEDYADAGADAGAQARPAFGGTAVEVVLAGGGVHQYRLAGRHPVFPWRYVTLDGARTLSVTDAEAGVMFPRFADILELGAEFAEPEEPENAEQEPAATPAGVPAETPVEVLIDAPAEVPAEIPVDASVELPVDALLEVPAEASAGIPADASVEAPAGELPAPAEPVETAPPAPQPLPLPPPPARKIVPAEVDFSGSVADKAALQKE